MLFLSSIWRIIKITIAQPAHISQIIYISNQPTNQFRKARQTSPPPPLPALYVGTGRLMILRTTVKRYTMITPPPPPLQSSDKVPKSVLRAVLGKMWFALHATRRTPHGTPRLAQAMSVWLVTPRRAPSRPSRGARVYTTTAMHKLSTFPHIGMRGKMWRMMTVITECARSAVMLDGEISRYVDISQGVAQG